MTRNKAASLSREQLLEEINRLKRNISDKNKEIAVEERRVQSMQREHERLKAIIANQEIVIHNLKLLARS